MISIKEIIIVEGAYDKIRLSSFIDGIIFVTGGFSIMTDEQRLNGLVKMSEENGAVILTDSDSAGFRIRNFLKNKLPEDKIKHAYIPDVAGKERRKSKAGAEGLMGVEGMTEDIIIDALKKAGCNFDNSKKKNEKSQITKADLFSLGLSGGSNSSKLRKILLEQLGLPSKMSSNMLCEYLSRTMNLNELDILINEKTSSDI